MVKSSAKDVFLWALGGALMGGAAGFALMYLTLPGPSGPLNLLISEVVAVITGAIGAGMGAVAEAVVHSRRKRR